MCRGRSTAASMQVFQTWDESSILSARTNIFLNFVNTQILPDTFLNQKEKTRLIQYSNARALSTSNLPKRLQNVNNLVRFRDDFEAIDFVWTRAEIVPHSCLRLSLV